MNATKICDKLVDRGIIERCGNGYFRVKNGAVNIQTNAENIVRDWRVAGPCLAAMTDEQIADHSEICGTFDDDVLFDFVWLYDP